MGELSCTKERKRLRACHVKTELDRVVLPGMPCTMRNLASSIEDLISTGRSAEVPRLINQHLQDHDAYASISLLRSYRAQEILKRSELQQEKNDVASKEALARVNALLDFPPPQFIAIGGFSGSGKSTLSRALIDSGYISIGTDVVRKKIFTNASGLYAQCSRSAIYEAVRIRAKYALQAGYSVVIDATFLEHEEGVACRNIARELNVQFRGFWCEAPIELLEERVRARSLRKNDFSDAGIEVLHAQLAQGAPDSDWEKVDMTKPVGELLQNQILNTNDLM